MYWWPSDCGGVWSRRIMSLCECARAAWPPSGCAKLASTSSLLNGVGAELSFSIESPSTERVLARHVPRATSVISDAPSCLSQPGQAEGLPSEFSRAKGRPVPPHDAASPSVGVRGRASRSARARVSFDGFDQGGI